MKISVLKDGPYQVTGGVPISMAEIIPGADGVLILKKIRDLRPDNPDNYLLCRCGKSKNAPFCDGSHAHGFDGTENAGHSKYADRAELQNGPELDLLDDNRCAFARFCHRQRGEVWTLTENSDNLENRREAIEGANACPSGRLTIYDKSGNLLEQKLKPEIIIIQDPLKNCSAGIYVRGGIQIESADGKPYEVQNRAALCRCGHSSRMPYCDATHVSIVFQDDATGK